MGKYDELLTKEQRTHLNYAPYLWIANELAEANRLKRYQLLKIYGTNNHGENVPTPELEEDKA